MLRPVWMIVYYLTANTAVEEGWKPTRWAVIADCYNQFLMCSLHLLINCLAKTAFYKKKKKTGKTWFDSFGLAVQRQGVSFSAGLSSVISVSSPPQLGCRWRTWEWRRRRIWKGGQVNGCLISHWAARDQLSGISYSFTALELVQRQTIFCQEWSVKNSSPNSAIRTRIVHLSCCFKGRNDWQPVNKDAAAFWWSNIIKTASASSVIHCWLQMSSWCKINGTQIHFFLFT